VTNEGRRFAAEDEIEVRICEWLGLMQLPIPSNGWWLDKPQPHLIRGQKLENANQHGSDTNVDYSYLNVTTDTSDIIVTE